MVYEARTEKSSTLAILIGKRLSFSTKFILLTVARVITTPLLLLDLCLTAGLPWPTILWTIGLDEAMIVTGLIGALVKSRYKWGNTSQGNRICVHELMLFLGFYTFGCVAMFGVFYQLAVVGRASAKRLGRDVHRVFLICGVLTLFVWLLYPIAWGLCEGGNVISPNDEAVFYGCLDFMAKPVFSIALIIGHWGIKPERLGLKIEDYTDPEKPVPHQENDLQASPRGHLA